VQVARTYFKAADQARQLPFAPGGDRTLLNTLLCAIRAARRFIYLEDQYLTPPDAVDFSDALVKKVQDGEIARLIIAIPGTNDQLFGQLVRGPFVQKLYDSQKTPGIVRVGCPRRRYTVPRCDLRASSGKLLLSDDLPNNLGQVSLAPKARIPSVPFWVAVDGELMYAYKEEAPVRPTAKTFAVYRGQDTLLVTGNPKQGTLVRDHKAGAAATVVELRDIYVHAKVLIVDDVFASIGSANVNRRGHYSDGECNIFVVPESLRADAANPVLALRKRLWAEMLDLPEGIVTPLLEDAITASELFERSWLLGNRFVPHHAYLPHVEALTNITVKTGDGVMTWIKDLAQIYATTQYEALFDNCVDPSSLLEP
jgi:phosphatidylserine/phosphatidylglycerophosphate/cardiolipin synthase-like enzyme